jgi:hypothetical protein
MATDKNDAVEWAKDRGEGRINDALVRKSLKQGAPLKDAYYRLRYLSAFFLLSWDRAFL